MKTIAVYNIKGGVGKTATAVNLAYAAAEEDKAVLLWDLDPQGAATYYFRIEMKVAGGGRALIRGQSDLNGLIKGSDFPYLDVLPAEFSCRRMDEELGHMSNATDQLARLVAPLAEDYDYLILDCAPSVSLLSENVFQAADALVIPTIPTTLSLRTLAQLMKHLKGRAGRRPMTLPFFGMVDRRKNLHRSICQWVEEQKLGFLATHIPYSSAVEQMGVHRNPVAVFSKSSPPARAYQALWEEVKARLAAGDDRHALFEKSVRRELEQLGRTGTASRPGPTG